MSAVDIYHWYVLLSQCRLLHSYSLRFGPGYGNMNALMDTFTTPFNTPLLCGVVAVIVQFFFAYRIWTIQQQQRGIIFVVGGILIVCHGSLSFCSLKANTRLSDSLGAVSWGSDDGLRGKQALNPCAVSWSSISRQAFHLGRYDRFHESSMFTIAYYARHLGPPSYKHC